MFQIAKRIFKDRWIALLSYLLGSVGLVFLYVALLPMVQESQVQVQEVLKSMPEGLLKAFGIVGVDLNSLEALLAMKHFNLVWPALLIFLLVSFAGGVIAGEIENRTIEITLASAKSRTKIFLGKYLSGIIYMAIFVVVSVLSAIPIAKFYGYDYSAHNYYTLMYLSLGLGFAVYGISFLLSSIFSSRSRVYAVSGLLYIAMYVLFIVVELNQSLENLKYLSFFYYYGVNDALIFDKLSSTSMIVFILCGLIPSIAALQIFNKRDISV